MSAASPNLPPDSQLADALETISDFIHQVTGVAPTAAEIADALTRYFVLNEIRQHIEMRREKRGCRTPSSTT